MCCSGPPARPPATISSPTHSPMTSMKERADAAPRSSNKLHRKSQSAAHPDARAVSNRALLGNRNGRLRLRPLAPNKNPQLWVCQNQMPNGVVRLEQCLRSSSGGAGGSLGSTLSTLSEHRPVGRRMVESWNGDCWSRFPLPKSRLNSKLQRRTIVHDQNLLWHLIMTLLHPPVSYCCSRPLLPNQATTKFRRRKCSRTPEQS